MLLDLSHNFDTVTLQSLQYNVSVAIISPLFRIRLKENKVINNDFSEIKRINIDL